MFPARFIQFTFFMLMTLCLLQCGNVSETRAQVAWESSTTGYPALAKKETNFEQQTTVPVLLTDDARPKQMALLLPLTGPFAAPAAAIKAGFMAAMAKANPGQEQTLRTYNTDNTDIELLYQQALQDGAQVVIGPLTKADVAVIAPMKHPVPTLLLNDVKLRPAALAYQFGLSPREEAMQVAMKAHQDGLSRVVLIAPADDWGNDILASFKQTWQGLGGQVVDTLSYGSDADLNGLMAEFLGIKASIAREKRLKEILGYAIETTPSRRQDFDMVFLLASPSKARQIVPLLNYYYAEDIPVYASSMSYTGVANPLKDKDLDRVVFCDNPWVLHHPSKQKNGPESLNSDHRLYALGQDSYALAQHLNQLQPFQRFALSDKSNVFYLNSSLQINRMLAWGQFKHGLVEQMPVVS